MQELNDEYTGPERRRGTVRIELSEEQLEQIVEKVYEKLYIQIGKNVVRQAVLVCGTCVLVATAFVFAKFGVKP